jgi:AbiU2
LEVEASKLKTPRKIDAVDALGRVRLISPRLREDVGTAVVSSILLNAANNTIPNGLGPVYTPFGRAYLGGQNALSLKLAMDLARIFDLSVGKNAYPAEAQGKASIPVLAALLKKPDVQDGLLQDAAKCIGGIKIVKIGYPAGSPPPDVLEALEEGYGSRFSDACQKAITDFLALAQGLEVRDSEENAALVRIRQFRDFRLAHSLFDNEPDALPIYADLELLLSIAKEATKHASFAIEGHNVDFDDVAQEDRKNADEYYGCVLDALKRAGRSRP